MALCCAELAIPPAIQSCLTHEMEQRAHPRLSNGLVQVSLTAMMSQVTSTTLGGGRLLSVSCFEMAPDLGHGPRSLFPRENNQVY